jgi:excinuclease ABC subunit C
MEGGQVCIQVFFFRTGQNWGNHAYFPRADKSLEPGEILSSFITQFYDDRPQPKLVVVSHDLSERQLIADALSTRASRRTEVVFPRRGEKRALVEHAVANAREALGRRLADTRSQARLLQGVQRTFDLPAPPRRIEVYDNSHIQGSNAVGAMIVAGREGLVKGQYRKFNIRSPDMAAGDDFAMMREVMTRRFSRLLKEHGPYQPGAAELRDGDDDAETADSEAFPAWPDLLLIDGGQGQLNAVRDILDELGIGNLPVAGVAKGPDRDAGREHFHVPGKPAFMLEKRDPVLYYVQRLRDEAHRFAIGSHRARRKKAIASNPLDEIAGIGPGRKKALLQAFGSARAVARANLADLEAVDGISRSLAQTIYGHFNEGAG